MRLGLGFYLNLGLSVIFVCATFYLLNEIKTQEREQALLEAKNKAQLILDRNLAIHTYFSHALKPSIFEFTDPIRDKDYFDPAWMSSTYAVREIDKNFKSINNEKYYYKECAINARTPENEADDFEKTFIKELNTNPKLEYRSLIRNIDDTLYYVTLRRGEVLEQSCLRCHSTPGNAPKGLVDIYGPERSFDRGENEVVSAISIRVPLSAAYARADQFYRHLSTIFIIVLMLLFVVQYFVYKLIILDPISKIKDRALSICENEELLGEEIPLPISREFGDLASAFNIMSLKLRNHMDDLEEKVEERTSKLQSSNEQLQHALNKVKLLSGFLPICASCKKIRDDNGYWNQIESYIKEHSEAQFSHGICPECTDKLYPGLLKKKN